MCDRTFDSVTASGVKHYIVSQSHHPCQGAISPLPCSHSPIPSACPRRIWYPYSWEWTIWGTGDARCWWSSVQGWLYMATKRNPASTEWMLTARVAWFTAFCIISLVEVSVMRGMQSCRCQHRILLETLRGCNFGHWSFTHCIMPAHERRCLIRRCLASQSCYGACLGLHVAQMRMPATGCNDDNLFRDTLRDGPASDETCDPVGGSILREADRGHERQEQEEMSASGSISGNPSRSTRPPDAEDLALLRQSCGGNLAEESSRSLEPLSGMQLASGLHSKVGISRNEHVQCEPGDGHAYADGARGPTSRSTTDRQDLQGHDGQDRGRGGAREAGGGSQGQEANDYQQAQGRDGLRDPISQLSGLGEGDHQGHTRDRSSRRGRRVERTLLGGGAPEADGGSDRTTSSPEHAHDAGRSVSRRDRSGDGMKQSEQPLPKRIGDKVMKMADQMMTSYQDLIMAMSLEGRDGLWEVACADNSWLSECASLHGIPARRINYANGFDIYEPDTWQRLALLRDQVRPRKIWFSLPCTKWCRWSALNYNTPERRERLETMRRRERRMLRHATRFILETLELDPDVAIYWEWTYPCAGWDQHVMLNLERDLKGIHQDWESCRVDGCCYGMMNRDNSLFLQKKWLIKTNDTRFAQAYRAKVCPRNHQHDHIQGLETSRSAYYPRRMVESIVRHWRLEIAPVRHVRLLSALCDDSINGLCCGGTGISGAPTSKTGPGAGGLSCRGRGTRARSGRSDQGGVACEATALSSCCWTSIQPEHDSSLQGCWIA